MLLPPTISMHKWNIQLSWMMPIYKIHGDALPKKEHLLFQNKSILSVIKNFHRPFSPFV